MTTSRLEGKVALVTGVTSGIGAETVRALLAHGMSVWGVGRDAARLQAFAAIAAGMRGIGFWTNRFAFLGAATMIAAPEIASCQNGEMLITGSAFLMMPRNRAQPLRASPHALLTASRRL